MFGPTWPHPLTKRNVGGIEICSKKKAKIVLGNLRNKNIDFRLLFALEPFTMVGAFGGAFLTSLLPSGPLKVIFGLFLILMSFKMGAKKKSSESSETSELPPKPWIRGFRKLNELKPVIHGPGYSVGLWAASVFGMLAGVIAGLFGIGGGVLKTPLMLNVFKVPVRTATATSLAMIMVTSLISGTTHFQLGHYSYPVLIPAVLGFVTGAVIGLWVGVKLTDQMIRKAISVTLFLAGVATFAHTLM